MKEKPLKDQEHRAIEAIDALEGKLAQLEKDKSREVILNEDAGESIKALSEEKTQLEEASQGEEETLEKAIEEARLTVSALQTQEIELDKINENVARLSAKHQSAGRLIEEAQRLIEKRQKDYEAHQSALALAQSDVKLAQENCDNAQIAKEVAVEKQQSAEAHLTACEEARALAQVNESEARSTLSKVEGEANTLKAEVHALDRLIARDRGDKTQIIDKISVEKGYEVALGAALGDDLKLSETEEGATGWRDLSKPYDAQPLPLEARNLSEYTTAPSALSRRLSQIGVVHQADGARLQASLLPGQRLVSLEGDLWRWDGFSILAKDGTSSAALRLQQINRLHALKDTLKTAHENVEKAKAIFDAEKTTLEKANADDHSARKARKEADDNAAEANRAFSKAHAHKDMCASKLEAIALAETRLSDALKDATEALKDAQAAQSQLENLETARQETELHKTAVEAARITMLTKRSLADELKREIDTRMKRRGQIEKDISNWNKRLETAHKRIAEVEERIKKTRLELNNARKKPFEIGEKRERTSALIVKSEARRRDADDALAKAETDFRKAQALAKDDAQKASEAREARARAEAIFEAAREQVIFAASHIEDEVEMSVEELFTSLNIDSSNMPKVEKIETDVIRLRRQRDALGAVNLRAEEDAREVDAEKQMLITEKSELTEAISKLRSGIFALNKEGRPKIAYCF